MTVNSGKFILILTNFFIGVGVCSAQTTERQVATNACTCLGKAETMNNILVSAIGDSVLICNSSKISISGPNGLESWSYTEFLSRYSLGRSQGEIIELCNSPQPMAMFSQDHSVSYRNKKLIVDWQMHIDSFIVSKKSWTSFVRPMYRQEISARNGILQVGNKKVVYNSFKVPKEAVDDLETRFQSAQISGNMDEQFLLIKPFFAVAASGNAKFIDRLLNFHKTFPKILENESEFLSKWQQCLRDLLADNNANALK